MQNDPMNSVVNVAAYKFAPLSGLAERREPLRALCLAMELKGTILLSVEGINLFVAGSRAAVDTLLDHLRSDPAIGQLEVKESHSDHQPFCRMLVKLKREIIAFGVNGIDPGSTPAKKISPLELKQWLDEKRPCTLLDVRNDYEVRLGTFENAVAFGIDHFRQFPAAADQRLAEHRGDPIVMFCTGGIRCEKAGPYLEREGFRDVYLLDGGILNYFQQCGSQHYQGECFVFDKRTAVDGRLHETSTTLCYACQNPLTAAEQESPMYVPSVSCPYCFTRTLEP